MATPCLSSLAVPTPSSSASDPRPCLVDATLFPRPAAPYPRLLTESVLHRHSLSPSLALSRPGTVSSRSIPCSSHGGIRQRQRLVRVCGTRGEEVAGDQEESFEDVDKQLVDYFTFKAVNTVLAQLLEMNPSQYIFLYNFVVKNKVQDSKLFIRLLVQERQELAERVMVTRLHLFDKWGKRYSPASVHEAIKDQNLELMRERLIQTIKFLDTDIGAGGDPGADVPGKA